MPRIGLFDSGPIAVIPGKSGIQRILGPGELSFGQTFHIPACAGRRLPGTLVAKVRLLGRSAARDKPGPDFYPD